MPLELVLFRYYFYPNSIKFEQLKVGAKNLTPVGTERCPSASEANTVTSMPNCIVLLVFKVTVIILRLLKRCLKYETHQNLFSVT